MAEKIPERLVWAVDTLKVQPNDHILEIGCGHGLALSLICDRLTSGKITALDRSDKMIRMARKRNSACAESGKVHFHTAELYETDFDGETFDKIFAVHVNVFWMKPARELEAIKACLKPQGSLFLFYQPPAAQQLEEMAAKLNANLAHYGFAVTDTRFENLPEAPALCVIAQLA